MTTAHCFLAHVATLQEAFGLQLLPSLDRTLGASFVVDDGFGYPLSPSLYLVVGVADVVAVVVVAAVVVAEATEGRHKACRRTETQCLPA